MSKNPYHFIFNQKMIVLSKDNSAVLVAKRQGEADLDGVYTYLGGKLEITDESLIDGLKREKDEELGEKCKIKICPSVSWNVRFAKKDGDIVIVAHYPARYISGEIELSDEYTDYKWIKLSELEAFEPKVANLPDLAQKALDTEKILNDKDWIEI